MEKDIVYITVEIAGQTIFRSFTKDFVEFSDPSDIGERVQDMFDSLVGEKVI